MDEVNLKNVTKNFTTTENGTILNVDLSFLAAFENVHFIIVLKPNFDGENCPDFFKIQSSTLADNQFFKQFTKSHRHSEGIKDFLSFWQQTDIESKQAFPKIDNTDNNDKSDAAADQTNIFPRIAGHDVIWIPTISSAEDEVVEKVISIINDVPENPSISIVLHDEKLKFLAGKIIGVGFFSDKSLKHINLNATEADVIVYLSGCSLKLQLLARARRLLIIVTYENIWNDRAFGRCVSKLKEASYENFVKAIFVKDCPYRGSVVPSFFQNIKHVYLRNLVPWNWKFESRVNQSI